MKLGHTSMSRLVTHAATKSIAARAPERLNTKRLASSLSLEQERRVAWWGRRLPHAGVSARWRLGRSALRDTESRKRSSSIAPVGSGPRCCCVFADQRTTWNRAGLRSNGWELQATWTNSVRELMVQILSIRDLYICKEIYVMLHPFTNIVIWC